MAVKLVYDKKFLTGHLVGLEPYHVETVYVNEDFAHDLLEAIKVSPFGMDFVGNRYEILNARIEECDA